jgi:sterol 14-demethylase
MMLEILAVVLAVVLAVGVLLYAITAKRTADAPPLAVFGIPVVGNLVQFGASPISMIWSAYREHGPVFTIPLLHKRLTFLLGPEASTPFYKATDDQMSQPEVYGFMTAVFGKNVVYDAEPTKRKQQMQHMSVNLKSNKLRTYVPKIERETREYLKRWGDSGEVNLLDALSELTILTASRCLHGDDVRENLFEDVARLYYDLDKGITPLSVFAPYAPTDAHRRRDAARKEMVELFSKVIEERRAKGNAEGTDILQVFIDLTYKDGTRLTTDEIVGLLIALLFAGQHTSSITSTWTTMLLLHNRHCLEKMREEQKQVLPTNDTPLDFDNVGNMNYLQDCVKEALRMYPPLIMLMRYCHEETEVTANGQRYVIPKGDIVVSSPAVHMRLPDVFKNPDTFDPERFSEERGEHKVPFAYLGFGAGIHACMGQQFGLLQVKTIVSILLRNFDLEPVDKEVPEPDYAAMVVGPHNHLKVRYRKRADATI